LVVVAAGVDVFAARRDTIADTDGNGVLVASLDNGGGLPLTGVLVATVAAAVVVDVLAALAGDDGTLDGGEATPLPVPLLGAARGDVALALVVVGDGAGAGAPNDCWRINSPNAAVPPVAICCTN
jgi:hypothetical protein